MRAPLTSVLLSLNDCETLLNALRIAVEDGSIFHDDDEEITAIMQTRIERLRGKLARATRRLKRKAPHGEA